LNRWPKEEARTPRDPRPRIGLEIHARLSTRSKLFCRCRVAFGSPPNTDVCPVCAGLPGALPVLNAKAVEYALKVCLALGCSISYRSRFVRKNYFYPDLPKGYQITQYERPLGKAGALVLPAHGTWIGIRRVHIEEDAGRSIHGDGWTRVDMNRSGVPLVEIVTEPDIRSGKEASAATRLIRSILRYLGVSDGNMEEGSLRCDVNVSLDDASGGCEGVKTEIKNLNSFKAIEAAVDFEVKRQDRLLARGEKIAPDTLLWDAAKKRTITSRSKEEAREYRYFPEPDLALLKISEELAAELRSALPELPSDKVKRFIREYGIPGYDAEVLTADVKVADYFEAVARSVKDAKAASNWIMGEVLREMHAREVDVDELGIGAEDLAAVITALDAGRVSMPAAKELFRRAIDERTSTASLMGSGEYDLIDDSEILRTMTRRIMSEHPREVSAWRSGKRKLVTFFMGEIMRKTGGRADPEAVRRIVTETLEKDES